MAKVKVLDKKSVVDGETVIITKTTEESLTLEDLQREKMNCQRQKESFTRQFNQLKAQYQAWDDKEKEIDSLISQLPKEEIESL